MIGKFVKDDLSSLLNWQNSFCNTGQVFELSFMCPFVTNLTNWISSKICTPPSPDRILLDRSPNIGSLISRWELKKFKNCWNKTFRNSRILTLLYQQFSNLFISQRDMSGPTLRTLSNNRWSGGTTVSWKCLFLFSYFDFYSFLFIFLIVPTVYT
jgi:hypothetical protein